ncbi:MAG: CHAD domain-containing protein [Phycisphaerae bacterium]|nr:CHAD domain-containing protein [Phycisphaerae bacterium]
MTAPPYTLDDHSAAGVALRERWTKVMTAAVEAGSAFGDADAEHQPDLLKTVRKATKTGRSLLPLLAPGTSEESLSGAERAFADAAHLLSPMRDRDAILKTIDRLFSSTRATPVSERTVQVRAALTDIILSGSGESSRALEGALLARGLVSMQRSHAVIEAVDLSQITSAFVGDTIADRWRDARRRANREWKLEGEELHELRKDCSRIVHQLMLLEDVGQPKTLVRFRQRLRRTTRALGDEHDMAILAERMAMERDRLGRNGFVDAALALCRTARRRLREKAGVAFVEAMRFKPGTLARTVA